MLMLAYMATISLWAIASDDPHPTSSANMLVTLHTSDSNHAKVSLPAKVSILSNFLYICYV